MTLKELITGYREEHNMSQRQFATACGLSNGYISMIEREVNPNTGEKIVPTLVALQKLATGMHISLASLLTLVDDMPVDITAEQKPTPVSEDGLSEEALAIGKAYMKATPKEQHTVRIVLYDYLQEDMAPKSVAARNGIDLEQEDWNKVILPNDADDTPV